MGYKHSEVLSAVLTNRACHTLAVYFLLNKKMKRLSKEYRVRTSLHLWPSLQPRTVINNHLCICRKCSSRRKRKERSRKMNTSRLSGGNTWTSSPSLQNRRPFTWLSAKGQARRRNTERVSTPSDQIRDLDLHIQDLYSLFISFYLYSQGRLTEHACSCSATSCYTHM